MSELKWNWGYFPYLDPPEKQKESALKAGYIKVVDKAEADKVIAYHKYKRCLAMARWCASRAVVWDIDGNEKKSEWYWKWQERWKDLAKKFKEAK